MKKKVLSVFLLLSAPYACAQENDPEAPLEEVVQDDARSEEETPREEVLEGASNNPDVKKIEVLPEDQVVKNDASILEDPAGGQSALATDIGPTQEAITKSDLSESDSEDTVNASDNTSDNGDASESQSAVNNQEESSSGAEVQDESVQSNTLSVQDSETQESQDVQEENITQEEDQKDTVESDEKSEVQSQEIPVLPQPTEPSEPTLKDEEVEIKGIDTVDVSEPKGNWLYKRIWWERAERQYEKIKQQVSQIFESRMVFFDKRTEIDRSVLDPFYLAVGMDQGELSEAISFYIQELNRERTEQGTLNKAERDLLDRIETEKTMIENLQKSIQSVSALDNAIDDALMKLLEQINTARKYETQAWEQFKAINRELSDKRARELFYSMDSLWKNVSAIRTYITGVYSNHFDQLVRNLNSETASIKDTLSALSEKGIDIKNEAEKLKKASRADKAKTEPKDVQEEDDQSDDEESEGFFNTVWGYVTAPFKAVGNFFSWVGSWFYTSSSEEDADEEDVTY